MLGLLAVGCSDTATDCVWDVELQERRKIERAEEEKRMAEQRSAEDARRKAEEVSKLVRSLSRCTASSNCADNVRLVYCQMKRRWQDVIIMINKVRMQLIKRRNYSASKS